MTAPTPPNFQSQLSQPVTTNNFLAVQSASRTVSNSGAAGSQSVTFTCVPGTIRVSYKITNSGTKGAYLCGSNSAAIVPAVASSATPTPISGANCVATCDYIGAGQTLTQDYLAGTDTISAICGGADTTTLEISIGFGQ